MSGDASHGYVRQGGVSLVIALILLLVLTIVGIASMNTSLMQERMAGNVNLQTLAFEAASAGIAGAAEFGLDQSNWPVLDEENGSRKVCRRGTPGWEQPTDWTAPTAVNIPGLPAGLAVEFTQRVGCFEPDPADIPTDWDEDYKVPLQLLVLTRGIVHRGDRTNPLALREIEVRVENRGSGETQCAMRIEGGVDQGQLRVPNSNFGVDGGEGGCPISTSPPAAGDPSGADLIKAAVEDAGRIGQYTPTEPGIHESEGSAPWNDPIAFAEFMNDMKTAVLAYRDFQERPATFNEVTWRGSLATRAEDAVAVGSDQAGRLQRISDFVNARSPDLGEWSIENCESRFYDGNTRISNANIPTGQCPVDFGSAPTNGRWPNSGSGIEVGNSVDDDDEFITYIAGHLGNPSNNSGSGIVITEGGVCWSGTANFNGLQIIGGGHYEIIGGGGRETTGAIILSRLQNRYGVSSPDFHALRAGSELINDLSLDPPSATVFGNSGLRFAGGGSHTITFKCGNEDGSGGPGFTQYVDRLNACLDPAVPIEPNCEPDDTGLGLRQAIASWREYIDRVRWE